MKEFAFILLLFSGCTACVYSDTKDYERCVPACGEYVYSGKVQNGQCVCDMQKVRR
jgi:hypothetical protein